MVMHELEAFHRRNHVIPTRNFMIPLYGPLLPVLALTPWARIKWQLSYIFVAIAHGVVPCTAAYI